MRERVPEELRPYCRISLKYKPEINPQTALEYLRPDKEEYKIRNVRHPKYRNYTFEAAKKYLADKEIGEYIFRPSSISDHHLMLTIQF